jgi:protein-S-isoprenylcysteine O-methyltransferase Ste14
MNFWMIIYACWIVFVLYWILSARSVKAAAKRQSWVETLAHKVPVGLGYMLLFVPNLLGSAPVVVSDAAFSKTLGVAICVSGLLGTIWSRRTLAGNWSSNVEFKQGHEFIDRGPYRFVRHPIYASLLLMSLGTALSANRIGGFAGLLSFFVGVWIKLKQEEKLLIQHFPDAYPAYKARVKALVPFVF